jgi:phosphohistidine phosphatase
MKRLLLLRHAKSSWDDPAIEDHDRPLTARGRKGAASIAKYLKAKKLEPAIVLCSTAKRAQETLEHLRPALPNSTTIKIEPKLYSAGSKELTTRLRRLSNATDSVLVIGHNPAMQELAVSLVRKGRKSEALREKFPTGALAVLDVPINEWRSIQPGEASLADFATPKRLQK